MQSLECLLEFASLKGSIAVLIKLFESSLRGDLGSLEYLGDLVEDLVLPLE